jgi:iron(III) transport system substrate-binding protein
MRSRIGVWALGGAVGLCLAANTALAQDATVVEKAKREGTVTIYTIAPTDMAQAFGDHFTAKYGIKVRIFRAGGAQIEQKLALEMRSERVEADVVELGDPTAILQLARKGGIASFIPANAKGLAKEVVDPNGYWVSVGQNLFPLIYNKNKVSAAEAPQSYTDLADPKWKGKVALASPNYGSTQLTFVKGLVELHGWAVVDALKQNGAMVARGWPDSENLIATGERLVGPDISIRTIQAVRKGLPLGIVFPATGTIAVLDVMAVLKSAPHPNAARLLIEFYLTDSEQKFTATQAAYPIRAEGGSPEGLPRLSQLKLHYVNLAELEAQHSEIVARWTDTLER